jgi:1-acyl-sn-glycerol-3-phosphate acyltransferase
VEFWPGPVQLAAAAPQVGAELLVGAGWLAASWLSYRRFFRRSRVTGSFDVG